MSVEQAPIWIWLGATAITGLVMIVYGIIHRRELR
jgi:hypothetical protein